MVQVPYTDLAGQAAAGTIGVGVPDDYQHVQATPDAFGAQIGQADQRLGAGFQQAAQAAYQVQDLYDTTTANNAIAQLRNRVTATSWGDPTNPNAGPGLLTLQGDQAMHAYQPAVDSLNKAQSDIAATLNPSAARMFNMQATRLLSDNVNTFDQHRAVAQQQWQVNSLDAQAASAQSAAIASSDDQNAFLHNLADQRNAVITKGSRLGWSPDAISLALADSTSRTYAGAVQRLADVNPQTAWSYYQTNRNSLTGPDQLAIESRLRPALLSWGSRDKADALMQGVTPGALPPGPVPDMIRTAASNQGVDPTTALAAAKIESGIGTLPDRPGSQYQGIYQMGDGAWAARGGTDANRGDLPTQVNLGVANLRHSQDVATQALGAPAAGWQTYLVHQQGDAGGPALLTADPNRPAVDALAPAYNGDRAAATQAIVKNGGTAGMTAGQFLNTWQTKFQTAASGLGMSAPPGQNGQAGQKPYAIGDSLAVGVQQANGTAGGGTVGASPDTVLDSINALSPTSLQGRKVVLSTGLSNDPSKIDVVQQQLDSLKARGADVTMLGVGSRPDLAPLNGQLQALAQQNGATFAPVQAGPDGVHPTDYRGLGVQGQAPGAQAPATGMLGTSGAATGPAAIRPNLPAMMEAATHVLDPFGQSNPQFVDLVQSRIRAKMNEQEYAQREAEKSNRETLLTAAMGPIPGTGSPATPAGAPSAANPFDDTAPALTPDAPAAAPSRPTSLDQLFQSPAARSAWIASTPETQRSVMGMIEHNARGEDPPLTPAAQSLYYQLSGMATNSRDQFQQLNLADPQYLSALPHAYWTQLVSEQRRVSNASVQDAARQETQSRALTVLKPDLVAAGFKTDGLKPGSTAAKDYDTFVGRLREGLDDFQQANTRRPNDAEVAKIGQTLLMQGTQRGTAGIFPWSSDSATRAFQVDPSQFVPAVPPAARSGIVQAYTQRFGQPPTEGQIAEAFMRQQATSTARQPARRPLAASAPPSPGQGASAPAPAPQAGPAGGGVAAAPAATQAASAFNE